MISEGNRIADIKSHVIPFPLSVINDKLTADVDSAGTPKDNVRKTWRNQLHDLDAPGPSLGFLLWQRY